MALFQPIAGRMRGSLAGLTYSHNKGGDYVRARSSPTNPSTARQLEVRSILATFSGLWSGLGDTIRNQWNVWAENNPLQGPLGDSYNMTGHQAYVALNSHLFDAGRPATNTPPPQPGPGMLLTFTVAVLGIFLIQITFTPDPLVDTCLMIWQTLPDNEGTNPNFNQAVLVGYSAVDVVSPAVLVIPKAFTDLQYANFYGCQMDAWGQVSAVKYKREQWIAP